MSKLTIYTGNLHIATRTMWCDIDELKSCIKVSHELALKADNSGYENPIEWVWYRIIEIIDIYFKQNNELPKNISFLSFFDVFHVDTQRRGIKYFHDRLNGLYPEIDMYVVTNSPLVYNTAKKMGAEIG